jgi:hypothetical protein
MFSGFSLTSLIVSTVIFMLAAWYINRCLDNQGFPTGFFRRMVVFGLAYLLSWGSSEILDWTMGKPPTPQSSMNMSQLLNAVGR